MKKFFFLSVFFPSFLFFWGCSDYEAASVDVFTLDEAQIVASDPFLSSLYAQYDFVSPKKWNPSDEKYSLFIVKMDDFFGVLDDKGNPIVPFEYDGIGQWPKCTEPIFYAKKGDKFGVFRIRKGPVIEDVIPFEYDAINPHFYLENRFSFLKGKKWGVVDRLNSQIIPFEYKEISLELGYVKARSQDGLWGVFSANGIEIISSSFDRIEFIGGDSREVKGVTVLSTGKGFDCQRFGIHVSDNIIAPYGPEQNCPPGEIVETVQSDE